MSRLEGSNPCWNEPETVFTADYTPIRQQHRIEDHDIKSDRKSVWLAGLGLKLWTDVTTMNAYEFTIRIRSSYRSRVVCVTAP